MKTSETIDKLSVALVSAQGEMGGAKKDSINPFFKSSYSDLTSIMQAVSKPFHNNGLCFIQGAGFNEGRIAVTTRIIHTSGQWIESTLELPAVKADPQAYGSAVTYAKRYSLQAMAGVPSVDDDAQYAAANTKTEQEQRQENLDIAVANNSDNIKAIKDALSIDDYDSAYESWDELTAEDKQALWLAPSKYENAPFTTAERAVFKSNEWTAARKKFHGE